MDTTWGDPGTTGSNAPALLRWCVTLVHCHDPALLGRRVVLDRERPQQELGRGCDAWGRDALQDDRISRRHALLELGEADELSIRDLGSHNGTQVRGRKVSQALLADGDVIAVGGALLLVHRAPASFAAQQLAGIDGVGYVHARLVEAVDKVAARATTVLLRGEAGTGKSHLAAEIHRRSGRDGRLITVNCSVVPGDRAYEHLFGRDGQSGCLAQAHGGTLVLDAAGDADPAFQRCALALLDRSEATGAARVIACCTDLDAPGELVARLARWVIHLAPLRSRREDIPALARAFVSRFAGRPLELHARLVRALLAYDWPGNLRELEAVIECAVIDAGDHAPLKLSDGARRLLEPARAAEPEPAAGAFVIAASGEWFHPDGGERVAIEHRHNLSRLLRALVDQLRERPGEPLLPAQLLVAGWPGERVLEAAGANRVHVALTTLRKLGLRSVIVRDRSGYFIDPRLPLVIGV